MSSIGIAVVRPSGAAPRFTMPWLGSASLVVLAAVLASTPRSAYAANECGAPVGGVIVCTGTNYPSPGISYNVNGITVTLNNSNLAAQKLTNGLGAVYAWSGGINVNDIVINALLFQSVQATGGLTNGLFAVNNGTAGNSVIRMDTGTVTVASTGAGTSALSAQINNSAGTGNAIITLNGGQVTNTGTASGVYANNLGTGNATITMTGGAVSTNTGIGLRAIINNTASSGAANVNIGGGTVMTASGTGVLSQSELGNAGITMTAGAVTVQGGANSALNAVVNNAAGTGTASIAMSGGTVTNNGSGDGLFANNKGTGTYNISVTGGTVTGGSGTGAAIHAAGAAGGTITIGSAATVNAGTSGIALNQTGGAATITSAGTMTGNINLSTASNVLDITGGAINGNISGGGNSALKIDLGSGSFTYGAAYAISGTNSVTMNSGSAEIDGSLATNTLAVNGGTLVLNSAATVSSGGTVAGGTLVVGDDAHASATLTGPLNVLAGGRLQGIGTIVGDVGNAGTIAPGNSIGMLTIAGNYVGNGGVLALKTVLGGDNSPTDKLVVTGNTSGNSIVTVTSAGGTGAQTVEGIKVVDVGGASNGTFTLQGNYVLNGQEAVVAGAYGYTLQKNGSSTPTDGDWYLRSSLINPPSSAPAGPLYQPGVPLYENYAQVLLGMNDLPSLQQRVGSRYWGGSEAMARAGVSAAAQPDGSWTQSAFWGRIEGGQASLQPSNTTGSTYNADRMKAQAGLDGLALENAYGRLIVGLTAQYGLTTAYVNSFFGNGTIRASGSGIGATATWYGDNGFYVDGQAQTMFYRADLASVLTGSMTHGNEGFGYALSVEGGKRIGVGNGFWLTPQAQLAYSKVELDPFTDRFGAQVSLGNADSLLGRIGLALNHQRTWNDGSGIVRSDVYAIGNLHYEFLNGTRVDVAGTSFANANDRLWGSIGGGGTYSWANGRYAIFGEVTYRASLDNPNESHSYKGTGGFRVTW